MSQATFKFISEAVGGSQFSVVSFTGHEAISALYRYQIEIKIPQTVSINLDDILNNPARFISEVDAVPYPVYGVLASIEELQTADGYVYYQAVLVPRLWWLSLYRTNDIYSDPETTIDSIIEDLLSKAGLSSGVDYDMGSFNANRLLKRDYRCQFGESDFDFISRLMENEGVFYYFDQSGSNEKIVFVNNQMYESISNPQLIYDVTASTTQHYDSIFAWSCRKQRLAEKVKIRDFNPYHPSLDISFTETIDNMGQGTEYFYGENVGDENEAMYLSEIRAQESRCQMTRYYGEGCASRLQAGYVFGLDAHPNARYNDLNYLTVEVSHQGRNLDMTLSANATAELQPHYSNSFTAIEDSEQFRPARKTPKPHFYGTMTAFVHAAQGTNDVEINPDGRYLVHLPFDRASGAASDDDPTDRKVSAWLRMAQPFAGASEGMYFPLKGGTEVLLTFINGDPDQPIISAALPNAAEPSLLNSQNDTETVIQTRGGNRITLKDDDNNEQERIVLQSPVQNSSLRLGGMDKNGNDDVGGIQDVSGETDGIQLTTDKDYVLKVAENNKQTATLNNEIISGAGDNLIESKTGQNEIKAETLNLISAQGTGAANRLTATGYTDISSGADCTIAAYNRSMKIKMQSDKLLVDVPAKKVEVNCEKYKVNASGDTEFKNFTSYTFNYGASHKFTFGITDEIGASLTNKMTLAANFATQLGNDFKIFIGLKQSFTLSADLVLAYAPNITFKAAPDLKKKLLELKKKDVEIDVAEVKLTNRKVTMNDINISLLNAQLNIDTSSLKIS